MCAMWGHTPGGRHLRLGENRAKSSRGASGTPRLRTGELQARPGSEQRSFRHAQAQNRTSMGLFFRGLSMFQTSLFT